MSAFSKNYVDFYQKAIIPIESSKMKANSTAYSHWLIAIEGKLEKKKKYSWCVSVYPSSKNGRFAWNDLVYESRPFDSFSAACEHARQTEGNYLCFN